jgi:hypothetical protein
MAASRGEQVRPGIDVIDQHGGTNQRPHKRLPPSTRAQHAAPKTTCTMLGCVMALLMAASMMAMRSRFWAPLMWAGSSIVLTATTAPCHRPLGAGEGGRECGSVGWRLLR